ncbi:MAG: GNAT family N-acetyltransferase [Candidatus Altiarchaeota archaeon]|nr:GNAT family N-acetyltransferase [Candidatus Altiarchaeota archaeon]
MSHVHVREFASSDVDGVLELYLSEDTWFEDIGVSKEYILECSRRQDFKFIVAEEENRLIGFIGFLFFTNVGRCEVGPIVVSRKKRNEGVGRLLVSEALKFLAGKGMKRAVVRIKAANPSATSFFMKCGFAFEAYLRHYTSQGEDVVQLVIYFPVT